MPDYVISVRNIRQGRFGDEPGTTRFLEVPREEDEPSPDHGVGRARWVDEVMTSWYSSTATTTIRPPS